MMKNTFLVAALALTSMAMPAQLGPAKGEKVVEKVDGMDVINTTTLAEDVDGYNYTTPVKIYVKSGKIVKVEALENEEDPEYFSRVTKFLLKRWKDMPIQKAATAEVDIVSGATYSSEAVITNVQRGAAYYVKHNTKKK